jgi:DNA polymerase-1
MFMARLIFDIETNGLMDTMTQIHCIAAIDLDAPHQVMLFADCFKRDGSLQEGIHRLSEADELIGHNIISFDCPAIEKIGGIALKAKRTDTQVLSELIWREPQKHSLASWGERLNCPKDDYAGDWKDPTQEMFNYCKQDAVVALKLYEHIMKQHYDQRAIDLEHELAPILLKATQYGFKFDFDAAQVLYCELVAKRKEAHDELSKAFKPWYEASSVVTPQKTITYKNSLRASRTKGASFTPITLKYFNPNSRTQIIQLLKNKYQWVPVQFTKNKNPKLNDEILSSLPYPEAQQLMPYMVAQKRIAQIAEGKKAWFSYVGEGGRIHGQYKQNGTISGRCAHRNPNIGQVPSVRAKYGIECRKLFVAEKGHELTGIDATSIELCCLGHYLAPFDSGAFVQIILNGNKKDGTDVYSLAGKFAGVSREIGKPLFLSWMYGAYDLLLGSLVDPTLSEQPMRRLGAYIRKKIEQGVPGLSALIAAINAAYSRNTFLKGLDGRLLTTKKSHAYLNLLLQSAAGILLKRAMVLFYNEMLEKGYAYGEDWGFCAFVHDEFQVESKKGMGQIIGEIGVKSIKRAGEFYDFSCPLTGEYAVGANWYETH